MTSASCKLGLFPTFFCLITGLTLGFLILCRDWEPDLGASPQVSALEELNLRRLWASSGSVAGEIKDEEAVAEVPPLREAVTDIGETADSQSEVQQDRNLHSLSGAQALQEESLRQSALQNHLGDTEGTQQGDHLDSSTGSDLDVDEELADAESELELLEDGQDQSPEETEKLLKKHRDVEALKLTAKQIRAIVSKSGAQSKSEDKEMSREAQEQVHEELQAVIEQAKRQIDEVGGAEEEAVAQTAAKATETTKRSSISIAALAEEGAKDAIDAQADRQHRLTATEQKFMFQMTDMLAMSTGNTDAGGESIQMKALTEDEANAQDAEEYNSKKAYGAREEDLVVFLQVEQGMPKIPDEVHKMMVKNAADGVPLLTNDIVKKLAKNNLVFVTCADWGHYDFALNWAAHLRQLGITNFLIGALDRQTSLGLAALGIPGFQMFPGENGVSGLSYQDFRTDQENFHRLSRQKVALARLFTDFGYDIVLNDVDVVWLKDPQAYLAEFPSADILTASDDLASTLEAGDGGLELVQAVHGSLSMSVLYIRHSPLVRQFVEAWDQLLAGHTGRVDQIAFNTLVAQHTTPLRALVESPRVATRPDPNIAVGVLPVARFLNGHTFCIQKLHQMLGVDPFSVHVNYNEGGLRGKRHRMREAGLWMDPPAYFETFNGYVQVLVEPPAGPFRTLSDDDMLRFHTESLQEQLAQMRAGLALSVALDRTLILPRLTCFCDRSWVGLQRCRAPGASGMPLPFTCPLDYVIEPNQLDDTGRDHGPRIDFREHNFLQRQPRSSVLNESMVAVVPSGLSFRQFMGTGLPDRVSQLHVDAQLTDDSLREALADQASVRVLAFTDAAKSFGGFRDKEWALAVSKRVGKLSGVWCCGSGAVQSRAYSADSAPLSLTAF